VSFSKSW